MRSRRNPRRKDPPNDSRDHHNDDSSSSNTPVETVLYSTPLDEPPAQPKMPSVVHVEKLDTGSASVGQPKDNRQPLDSTHLSRTVDPDPSRTGSMMLEPMLTPTVTR